MPTKFGRVSESEVALSTMQYLNTVNGLEAPIDRIVKALPSYLTLNDADRAISETRPNEEMWEQQVRNIVSHKLAAGNAIYDGYLEHVTPARLRLTEAGVAHLKTNGL